MKKKALCILLACAMTFSSFAGVNLTAYATDVADAAAETDEAEEADAADVTEETDAADTAADATDEADEVIQTEEVVENYATDAMMASVPADALYEWDFEEADGSATIRTTTGNESPIMSVSENQEVASTFFGEAGKVGRAIVFNGGATGKYVNLDLQKNVEKDTSWSAAAWIKTRANGSMVLLSSNDNTDGKAKGAIKPGVAGGETLQGKGYVKYGVGEYRLGEQGDYLPQNVWSHVVYVCDAATDTMTLYVNGVRCDSHNVYIDAPLQRLGAGCNVPQATDKMNASVDELKVYGRALSATEVAGLYNSYNTATEVPDLPITVESRYASTRISWEDVAATSYDVYRVVGLKDTAENAETDDVKVGTVAQGVGTCVDDFADLGMTAATINNYVGRTDSYYVVASYIETEGAEPEVIARTSAPKADKYATGLEAVQKHAAEEQFHVDLTYTADVADGRTFANNRVYSAAEAEINRIKDLTEGTIMVTFQSDGYADTPETLYTLKNTAFNATSYDSGAHISVSQNGATSLRPYLEAV